MPVGNWARYAEVRIVGEIHGQQTVNVWHMATDLVANDQGSLNTILAQLAQAMHDCVVQFLLPAVTSDWRFVKTDAREIHPAKTDPIVSTGTPANVGEKSAASCSFAAFLVNLHTGAGGRRGRGKKFLPPPGEGETTASLADDATLVLLAAFLTCVGAKFMGADPESNWHLGVLSQTDLKSTGGSIHNAFRLVASMNPSAEIAVMRSRRRGHGG